MLCDVGVSLCLTVAVHRDSCIHFTGFHHLLSSEQTLKLSINIGAAA